MTLTQIFEELFAGKRIKLSFPTDDSFNSFFAQLRTAKSRYESRFETIFGESIDDGKVVRVLKESTPDGSLTGTFYLGESKRSTKNFTIISITEVQDAKE